MSQLTKEFFEQTLDRKLTSLRDDLNAHTDAAIIGVKNEIADLRTEMYKGFESVRTEMQEGFDSVDLKLDAIHELLDVRNRVETLEKQMREHVLKR